MHPFAGTSLDLEIPEIFQRHLDLLFAATTPNALKEACMEISTAYRTGQPFLFREKVSCLAYFASRLPATYAVAYRVLSELPRSLSSWIDVGAGPGTASWAAATLFPGASFNLCIEQSHMMTALGKELVLSHPILSKSQWLPNSSPPSSIPSRPDALLFSYSLGELKNPQAWIEWWWAEKIPFLVIMEPGTPARFALLREIREKLLLRGASVIAPCTHVGHCPLLKDDWCHFSLRIPRGRLQRHVKGAQLGYEDEKYAYLIISRENYRPPTPTCGRIIGPVRKESGGITFTLCTHEAKLEKKWIAKREKELYAQAKKAEWGAWFFSVQDGE
ncbi:MAG: hypothetical protein KGI80_02785 [Verrucomicrobiota bacterium]|nr:hypothetical protein [Verrucomicrobiota bacterium]